MTTNTNVAAPLGDARTTAGTAGPSGLGAPRAQRVGGAEPRAERL
jgi:hypothetical protein